mgnify:CR=1 FL=1
MRKEKFTKGPWRVGPVDDTLVMDANREEIAQALGDHDGEDWESVYANAALISAAPDLYEALSDLVCILELDTRSHVFDAVCSARAALTKARGES